VRVRASVARLGRPVACMAPPSRLAGGGAALGLGVPAGALEAVARLLHGDGSRTS
jgi:hypothetical protein